MRAPMSCRSMTSTSMCDSISAVGSRVSLYNENTGTRRAESHCRLQVWVADDLDHRLAAGKLHRILGLAAPLLPQESLPVDVEYEAGYIAQFPLESLAPVNGELHLRLGVRHTACLAPDKCGVPPSAPRPIDFSVFPVRPPARCC